MQRRARPDRPELITSVAESPDEELERRRRQYAVLAVVFIGSFTAAALLHRETVVALLLCGVAIVTMVVAVSGANIRKPRRRPDDPRLL